MILIWLTCFLGQFMHLAAQVYTIKSAKNNTASSYLQIVKDRFIPIAVRMFLCSMAFGVFVGGGLPQLLTAFHMEAPQWSATISVLLANTGIVGICLSGLVGFALDSLIGFVPMFKSYLPAPIDAGNGSNSGQ